MTSLSSPLATAEDHRIALVVLVSAAVLLGLILLVVWSRARRRVPELSAHYARLGRYGPHDNCPCKDKTPPATYQKCCRPRDIEKLIDDVRAYQLRHWGDRSFAGRRATRSMSVRMDQFPLPQVNLPPWVVRPERFQFPIDDAVLRSWTPLQTVARGPGANNDAADEPL